MASGDEAVVRAATIKVSNKFFNDMLGRIKKISDEESLKMANSMEFILRHRQQLKGGSGQYPRWDPSFDNPNQKNPKSKKSFDMWRVTPYSDGSYVLSNSMRDEGTFNYVRALISGSNEWNTKGSGPFPRLRNGPQGRLYSYQLPQGLGPWKEVKRKELIKNISDRIRNET